MERRQSQKSPYRLAPLEMQELSETTLRVAMLNYCGGGSLYAKVTYLRFIANCSKIIKPLTSLTKRIRMYEWGPDDEEAF
ncbi:hypothetical protein Tco_0195152 [Tanacetum coccineum]